MAQSVWSRAIDMFRLGPDDGYYEQPLASQIAQDDEDEGAVYQLHPETTSDSSSCPLIRATPKSMDEATCVADEIKRQVPVILNLEDCNPEDARRIRDFLGGVTYGLNGYMKKIGSWVYACSPLDMPIKKLVLDGPNLGQPRYENDDEPEEIEDGI
jgi:FtsZ-interacting cell division protein YlmF